ncbi:hypothetical protein AVEN_220200-1 [Araneus ventricosus]|uniref:Uncharacterized protein n=1 Tax=Araneus ventricosus TaxID=182803 RepID=A0A4Y2GXS8_ARAVE|nr:hypothetical protein AVEN_220200-1 [Araneus ventricosus]
MLECLLVRGGTLQGCLSSHFQMSGEAEWAPVWIFCRVGGVLLDLILLFCVVIGWSYWEEDQSGTFKSSPRSLRKSISLTIFLIDPEWLATDLYHAGVFARVGLVRL